MIKNKISILSNFAEVAPFVTSAISGADSDKNALGFIPASVFHEYARKEQLYVATALNNDERKYAGHILFDCRPPRAKVLQIYSAPDFRGVGVARLLVEYLKEELSGNGFITIYARVAEDLSSSNSFWERQGFYVQQVEAGGKAKNRTILIRAHELAAPQLFEVSGISSENPVGYDLQAETEIPIFLIDLNVFYDLQPRRSRSHDAIDLFRSERLGNCRLVISTELEKELKRTATPGRTDPMQAYARIFDSFEYRDTPAGDLLIRELTKLVFPQKSAATLNENDKSDLRHLATAIQNGLSGLITNDEAVLNVSAQIRRTYGVYVFSPTSFKEANQNYADSDAYDVGVHGELWSLPIGASSEDEVRDLLIKIGIKSSCIYSDWAVHKCESIADRVGVWLNNKLIGYMVNSRQMGSLSIQGRIAIDESSPVARRAAQALIRALLDKSEAANASKIRLDIPMHQAIVRENAIGVGFFGSRESSVLTKIQCEMIVNDANWFSVRQKVEAISSLRLPEKAFSYRDITQQVQVATSDGKRIFLSLERLENLLSPILFCLANRGAVITPVRRSFSEPLFGHSSQLDLLPKKQVGLHQERHYLSDPKNIKVFLPGNIILFYESLAEKGRGEIVAIARVKRAYLKSQEMLDSEDFDPSVLDAEGIVRIGNSKMKTITVFDNLIRLPNPVSLAFLKEIGCGRPVDLLTTHMISYDQFQSILKVGFSDAKR